MIHAILDSPAVPQQPAYYSHQSGSSLSHNGREPCNRSNITLDAGSFSWWDQLTQRRNGSKICFLHTFMNSSTEQQIRAEEWKMSQILVYNNKPNEGVSFTIVAIVGGETNTEYFSQKIWSFCRLCYCCKVLLFFGIVVNVVFIIYCWQCHNAVSLHCDYRCNVLLPPALLYVL